MELRPPGHLLHVSLPDWSWYVPGLHFLQLPCPVDVEYMYSVPGAHSAVIKERDVCETLCHWQHQDAYHGYNVQLTKIRLS